MSAAATHSDTVLSFPKATFHALPQSDGSASYVWAGHTIVASVNGPIEPQRRDELPEEAFLEVHVREASGGGSPHTRHLETLLHHTFSSLILTHAHPRTLIQITLQILRSPPLRGVHKTSILPSLPHLFNAGVLAIMDANIPMSGTACGICALARPLDFEDREEVEADHGEIKMVMDDEGRDLEEARREGRSLQVFVYSGQGKMMLTQGEGACSIEEWKKIAQVAERVCEELHEKWLRILVEAHLEKTTKWMRRE